MNPSPQLAHTSPRPAAVIASTDSPRRELVGNVGGGQLQHVEVAFKIRLRGQLP